MRGMRSQPPCGGAWCEANSLCNLGVLCVSVVRVRGVFFTTDAEYAEVAQRDFDWIPWLRTHPRRRGGTDLISAVGIL